MSWGDYLITYKIMKKVHNEKETYVGKRFLSICHFVKNHIYMFSNRKIMSSDLVNAVYKKPSLFAYIFKMANVKNHF